MFSCQKLWFVTISLIWLEIHTTSSQPVAEALAEPSTNEKTKLLLITDDVIHDNVEKDHKKVIRVNPLDLPTIKEDPNISNEDSSLYNIQSLKPMKGQRKYTTILRSKPQINLQSSTSILADSPITKGFSLASKEEKLLKPKHQPKKKQLHFVYNQEDLAGNLLSKSMHVHVAPGAYPVYYVVSKINGRFGKHPLKRFGNSQSFMKYLMKNKLENLPALETYDEI